MMRIYALCLALTISVTDAAEKGQPHDVSAFDVAGVKLGMNQSEAVTALTQKLGVDAANLTFDPYPQKDIILQAKVPKYFVYEAENIRIQVNMVPAIPVDAVNPLRVNHVIYETKRTDANMQKMRDMAFQKYGVPSNGIRPNDHVTMKYSWCQHDQSIQFNHCFNAKGPKLELTAPKLNLHDPRPLKRIQEHIHAKKDAEMKF